MKTIGLFLVVILTATPLVSGLWGSHRSVWKKALYRRDNSQAIKVLQSVIDDIPSLVELINKTRELFDKLKNLQDTLKNDGDGRPNMMGGSKKMKQGGGNSGDKPKWWNNMFRLPEGWNFGRFGNNGNTQAFSYAFS